MEKLSTKCKLIGLSALLCLALGVAIATPEGDFPIFTDVDSMLKYCSRADTRIDNMSNPKNAGQGAGNCAPRLTCGEGPFNCHANTLRNSVTPTEQNRAINNNPREPDKTPN